MAFMLSFSHCLGMCGGFVIAYNTKLANKPKSLAFLYSLTYQISRIFAYVVLGGVAGYFGSFFKITRQMQGYFYFAIGVIMVVLGFALLMRGKILAFIENDKIWQKFFAKPMKKAISSKSYASFVLLGFLNGLLPCGVVYTFLTYAIRAQSAWQGAIIMLIFGISTLPVLMSFSAVTNLLNIKFKNIMLTISVILIIIFGIYNAYLGFSATI